MNKQMKHSKLQHETAAAVDFHHERMHRERKITAKQESSSKPEGNDEYEQMVAEDANFNAKPLIETVAYLIAERRGFAPGSELSDWLRAEAEVEGLLRGVH